MRNRTLGDVMGLVTGDSVAQAVAAAVELGVVEELAAGPRPVDALARAAGADPDALYRLLRALSGFGVVEERDGRVFALTGMGEALRRGVPGAVGNLALMMGSAWHRRSWSELADCVRTGRSAFERLYGGFAYYRDDPAAGRVFDEAMTDSSAALMEPLLRGYDFTRFRVIVDVGGGQGTLLAAALSRHPEGRGVLYDLPSVIARAGEPLERAGVAGRCELVSGDFFSGVPCGGDLYLLANIVHDWDDEHAVRILANCAAALSAGGGEGGDEEVDAGGDAGGRVLLVEAVMPETRNRPTPIMLIDLEMLVMCDGGRQRTAAELDRLLSRAGLRLTDIRQGDVFSLVEAESR
ncbi:methyltransferase [Thermopolyspora sp. NPDC052614]|uniref:methyltransferase n=1 Tax=Thermopolyspora sp. NPDC052614 TaxID=3155682 RepID=UPI00344A3ADC